MTDDGVGLGPSALYQRLQAAVAARHPAADLVDLHDLAVLAADCHQGQRRRSGDQYLTHPLVVATYVAEWGRSLSCIHAALLHDIADGGRPLPTFRGEVDDRVLDLVELCGSLDRGELSSLDGNTLGPDALAIKLADRLHNARTWRFVPPAKARRKARETIELYAPAARRLGLPAVAAELHGLAVAELASARDRPAPAVDGVAARELSSSRMLGWAVNRLPAGERERYAAEWSGDLSALEGRRERWMFGFGVLWSARRLR